MASKSQSSRSQRPPASGGGRRRPPPPPAAKPKPWGLVASVVALALFVGGMLAYAVVNAGSGSVTSEFERLRESLADNGARTFEGLDRNHVEGAVSYPQTPPAGGDHNAVWQACQGNVYSERIANEHAVHSLEHGAVWITYQPELAADQVRKLAGHVQGTDYMLMSPYPGLPSPVVLSAWGAQLAVPSADDPRIDEFIRAYRVSASQEPGASCSSPLTVQGVDGPLTSDQLAQLTGAAPMPQAS